MNILVLHGPNLNLIGVRSSQVGEKVTLDKIDRALKNTAHKLDLDITLKTLQTHFAGKAITFLQRNRNWADGLIFSPGPWAKANYDLLDTLKLVQIPMAEVFFNSDFDSDKFSQSSIFSEVSQFSKIDHPINAYTSALSELYYHLSSH